MIESWTGVLVGKMHNNKITLNDVAQELGVTTAYVSMILNGARNPANAQERLECAVATIIDRNADATTSKCD